jgi:UDP-2,3-diacylglucosamine pyrophosphatase LpxH
MQGSSEPGAQAAPHPARPQRGGTDVRPAERDEDGAGLNHYRAIFLSDIHLGTAGCKAEHLLDFLRHNESDELFLVGDIIDGWALRSRFYWPQSHNDVIQKVLRKARKGTRVVFVPGNHDEAARQFCGLRFGEVSICAEAEHRLVDGRRLWVVHGDIADGVIRHVKWLAHVGDALYDWLLWLNRHLNNARARLGFGYWSLSQYLKHKVKNAVSFISDFERVLVREARRRGYDGVICGHIHHAQIRDVDGALYINDGDWVESLTALVETHAGELRIVVWDRILAPNAPVPHWSEDEAEAAPQAQPAEALAARVLAALAPAGALNLPAPTEP